MLTLNCFVQSGDVTACWWGQKSMSDGDRRVRRCEGGYIEGLMNRLLSLKVWGRIIVWDKARDRISGKLLTR